MTATTTPAEAFPPGDYLREELAERGWAEGEFAEIIGRPVQAVSEILNGKKDITPDTAVAIGAALGTSAELWVSLQAAYRLHQARSSAATKIRAVERRARLRDLVPVRELQKRRWLPDTSDLAVLEDAVRDLLGMSSIGDEPRLAVAARRTNAGAAFTPEQTAWIARIQQLGARKETAGYDARALLELATQLVHRLEGPHELHKLEGWLRDCGVALVIELPLRNSKMDGMVSLVGSKPVIGLSTRGDRMDGFVFTLLHEIAHLTLGHLGDNDVTIDEELDPNSGSECERAANEAAAKWIFPDPPALPPGAVTQKVLVEVARAQQLHVSFLIGRLQNQGLLGWKDFRNAIPKVRPYIEVG